MQKVNLDLSAKNVIPLLSAKQGDVGRKINVTITDDGKPYALAGSVFSVWYSGASGEGNYTNIGEASAFAISGNTVTVELITQMLTNSGKGEMCLIMNTAEGKKIGTWNIPYYVEKVPGAGSQEAKMYYDAFQKAVENLPYPDETLTIPGKAADAAAVGTALAQINTDISTTISISESTDLDGVTVPGRYGCQTAEVAGTLLGCPVAEPFTLDVRYSDGKGPRVGQELKPAGKGARLYRQFVGYEDILSDEAKALRARVRKVFPGEFIYIEGGDYGETGDQVDIYSGGSDTGWYSDGASTFALSTGKQLYGLMELVNSGKTFAGKTVKLTKDIVINEGVAFAWGENAPAYSWTPIGPSTSKYFGGTLDGQGHYISGLYNVKGRDNGFMCYTVNATIKNLAIINSYFENDAVGSAKENDAQVLGTFVGRGYGITLQELYTDAYLVCTAKDWLTGGIAGFVKSEDSKVSCGPATVTSVCFAGNITTNTGVTGSLIGGIVGGTDNSYATVRNSLFIGSISTNDNQVGGIVGRISQNSVVDGCVAVGSINKQSSVGAIVGQLYQAGSFTITDCYYSGEQGLPLYGSKSDSTSTVTTTGSKALPAECEENSLVPTKWAKVYDSENKPTAEDVGSAPAVESIEGLGCYYRIADGEKEWINPPMASGVEYRTTERWAGRAIYCYMINIGALPNAQMAQIAHGLPATHIIRCEAVSNYGVAIPFVSNQNRIELGCDKNNIYVTTTEDYSYAQAYITIYYTKD